MGKYSLIAEQSEQAMSIRYNTMVYELKRQGKKVLIMSLGEAYFDIPLFPMNDLPFPDVYHYSHSMGLPELREKLSKYFSKKYDIPFNYENEIIVTAGSKIGVYMTLMAIINSGDEVIVQEPCWVSYPEQIKLCYGIPVQVPSDKSIYEIEKYITDKTKAIIISNPHNPTGNVYTEKELRYLLGLAEKHNIWILSDEAYSDFVNDNSFISPGRLDREKKHTIIFNSISKNYGISGWRLGYVISNEKLIYQVLKINQHLMTCPATILEYYVTKYFDKILDITLPQINELINKRHRISGYMQETGLKRMPGEATFYFFVSIAPSKLSSEEFCTRLLKEEYICVVPGIGYGKTCDRYIRVSIGTATYEENIYGLNKIKELIGKTS